ncbi:hypothetical protein BZG36_03107 [Bifiguratus adelaidae]|uniref:NmrA-like domain-containing protein n=1 Tax=Bifiguratus adelaidae TaxID=1938954 RepID=A0A261Y0P2_9FUNG|nr:hypothetical protein BZG36_03107 [Bifiguratus adelaidae]
MGATGNQGGAVARALLSSGGFNVNALSRKTNSEVMDKLVKQGATPVQADPADKDSLVKAFQGCDYAFLMTTGQEQDEFGTGKAAVDACIEAAVKYILWSTLDNTSKMSGGRIVIPFYDNKAKVQDYIQTTKIAATFVHPGCFISNFIDFHWLRPADKPNTLIFAPPIFKRGTKVLCSWIEKDMGQTALAAFSDFGKDDRWLGREVIVGSIFGTFGDAVKVIERDTGVTVEYAEMSRETCIKFMPSDVISLFEFHQEFTEREGVQYPDPFLVEKKVLPTWTWEDFVEEELKPALAKWQKQ